MKRDPVASGSLPSGNLVIRISGEALTTNETSFSRRLTTESSISIESTSLVTEAIVRLVVGAIVPVDRCRVLRHVLLKEIGHLLV